MKKQLFFIFLVMISATLLLSACGGLDQSIWTPDPPPPPAAPPPPPTASVEDDPVATLAWEPGVYTGVGEGGFGGDISVEVLISDLGQIASITVTDHSETQAFMEMAESLVLGAMISTQTIQVDTFAGATMTSIALINAVEDALADAAGVAPAPTAPAEVPSGFTPGTFTGTGEGGFGGDITVEVVVDDNGQIISITAIEHRETQAFMDMVNLQVAGAIISGQTTNVDTFAGATMSSVALIEAVENALADAS